MKKMRSIYKSNLIYLVCLMILLSSPVLGQKKKYPAGSS